VIEGSAVDQRFYTLSPPPLGHLTKQHTTMVSAGWSTRDAWIAGWMDGWSAAGGEGQSGRQAGSTATYARINRQTHQQRAHTEHGDGLEAMQGRSNRRTGPPR